MSKLEDKFNRETGFYAKVEGKYSDEFIEWIMEECENNEKQLIKLQKMMMFKHKINI